MSDSFQVCETCGVKFPQSTEVTSSRVLCPACAAQRRAALRAAKGAVAPAGAPAAAAPAAAPAAAAPAARPAKPPAPAPRREAAAPPAAEPEPAPRRQRETREAKRPAHGPHEHLDVRRMREESQQKVMKMAWAATGVLLLIAGGFWLYRTNTLNNIDAARKHILDERQQFVADLKSVNLDDEAALKAAKKKIDENRQLWRGKDIENDVSMYLAKFNAALALKEKTRSIVDQMTGMETQAAANPPVEQLAKLFMQVRDSELAAQAQDAGGIYKTRYDADVQSITNKYIDALRSKANSAASATTGEGLAPYGQLEDALRIVMDKATDTKDVDAIKQYQSAYAQCVTEINQIVERVFDDAYIEKAPWKDLLADSQSWLIASSPTMVPPKFGGGLTLENPEGGQSGGLLYTPGKDWRDYVLELEVNLKSGTLSVFTRVGDENRMDTKQVAGFTYGTKNTKYMAEYGKPHTIQVRVIGKTMTVYIDGSVQSPETLSLSHSRRGKPGLAITGGTSAVVTKMRVRLLR